MANIITYFFIFSDINTFLPEDVLKLDIVQSAYDFYIRKHLDIFSTNNTRQ